MDKLAIENTEKLQVAHIRDYERQDVDSKKRNSVKLQVLKVIGEVGHRLTWE